MREEGGTEKGDLLHAHGKSPHGAHFIHWDEWGKQTGNTTRCWNLELTNIHAVSATKIPHFSPRGKNGLVIPKQPYRKQVLQWTGPQHDKDVIYSASFPQWFPISHGRNWHLWARQSTVHVHRLLGWHNAVLCRNRLSNAKATPNPWGHHTRLQGSHQRYPYWYCCGVQGLFQGRRKIQTI